ncbi:flagellar hook-basal body complex protein FliE [Nocardioides sp.]|uniref:flagellar hook-basal body complex protein FliE n=1 Tax=Nocardioides sp. TaxID=35761 RepID=UPI003516B034
MSSFGIESIGAAGFTPFQPPSVDPAASLGGGTRGSEGLSGLSGLGGTSGVSGVGGVGGVGGTRESGGIDFGNLVVDGIEKLDTTQRTADTLAVQAASGQLTNIHDYTMAATQAQLATQLTVALRNKAVEAFTEIMRMQVG